MTSGQESSKHGAFTASIAGVESLAGVVHPHAIEVQDFSHYALVIDVRPRASYEEDHIPGAIQVTPPRPSNGPLTASDVDAVSPLGFIAKERGANKMLPAELASLVEKIKLDQAILVYCGRGGLDSLPLVTALRSHGWTVDVLPGGWINYRRWVQAGLEVLPRLIAFRVIASSLGSEAVRVLHALREAGHQVLDVEGLAGWRHGSVVALEAAQPPQAWFESQLLQSLRGFDPRLPVWIGDTDQHLGSLVLPGALSDALTIAPTAVLDAPLQERIQCWREDEPVLGDEHLGIVKAVASSASPPDAGLLARWHQLAAEGASDLLPSLLREHFDATYAARSELRCPHRHALPPLRVPSLAPASIAAALREWLPCRDPTEATD